MKELTDALYNLEQARDKLSKLKKTTTNTGDYTVVDFSNYNLDRASKFIFDVLNLVEKKKLFV